MFKNLKIVKLVVRALVSILNYGILKKKVPLCVSFCLTYRCNKNCRYCNIPNIEVKELSTRQVLNYIEQLFVLGARWINFTGGEPLLREDLGLILEYASSKGMYCSIATNGSLVRKKLDVFKDVDRVVLSLDGKEEVNDYVRGRGSFKETVEAVQLLKQRNISVLLSTVLSSCNIKDIEYILDLSKSLSVKVSFQPSTLSLLGGKTKNDISLAEQEYRHVITKLKRYKSEGNKNIANSIPGLDYLFSWPHPKKIKCFAGKLNVRIEPNGLVNFCNRVYLNNFALSQDATAVGVEKAIDNLPDYGKDCNSCWCAHMVEFNLMASFNVQSIFNAMSFFGKGR